MTKVFIDTDICIDLLSGREPFNSAAEKLFSNADKGKFKACVSSLSFANIEYVIRALYKVPDPRKIISRFRTLVTILKVDEKTIDLALTSDFKDFEDAIQYYTAIENNINILLTRNIKDYKKANINVLSPEMFLSK